jgi:hypothetical protein
MSVVHRLRGAAVALGVALTALVVGLVAVPPANAASCVVTWGSGPKIAAEVTSRQLTGVRAGRHACYDRLVIDLNGAGRARAGYHVSYVGNVVEDGSGQVVPLRGGAKLAVVVPAPAYNGTGGPTYIPANPRELADVTGFQTFRQLAFAGSFEGQTAIGLGVRARLPVRAFVLAGPGTGQRLVIDVAHRW